MFLQFTNTHARFSKNFSNGYVMLDFVFEKKNTFVLFIYFLFSDRVDNVRAGIENSHRVVILLSEEFIKDDWSNFTMQQVFLWPRLELTRRSLQFKNFYALFKHKLNELSGYVANTASSTTNRTQVQKIHLHNNALQRETHQKIK